MSSGRTASRSIGLSTTASIIRPSSSATVESCFGSHPTCSTRRPIPANVALTLVEVVDLPMPPFPKKTNRSILSIGCLQACVKILFLRIVAALSRQSSAVLPPTGRARSFVIIADMLFRGVSLVQSVVGRR